MYFERPNLMNKVIRGARNNQVDKSWRPNFGVCGGAPKGLGTSKGTSQEV